MKIKKRITVAVLTGMLSVTCLSGVFASGLGVVNFRYLEQNHRNYNTAVTKLQNDAKGYQTSANSQLSTTTDNQQKQQIVAYYRNQLAQDRATLFRPIDQDILKQIITVERQRGLDNVAMQGAVLDGPTVDITQDVLQRIK